MRKVNLDGYEITLDKELYSVKSFLDNNAYSQYYVLCDTNTKRDCLPYFLKMVDGNNFTVLEVQPGEQFKNLTTCQSIWKQLLDTSADRNSLVINLGGGVLGDMGGFAASCYKRGVDFLNIPTTILSQVDASIGGKLAVDFKYGKNLIGLFRNPRLVAISTFFYKTLSEREYKNGFAEIFKHALIKSKEQWKQLKSLETLYVANIEEIVYQSLLIKKEVVEEDPFEKGLRKILNFGHTIGHAIEAISVAEDKDPLLHGEAIVIGMICEAFISKKICGLSDHDLNEICEVLFTHYEYQSVGHVDRSQIWKYMAYDKKNEKGRVMGALLSAIGKAEINVELTEKMVNESLDYYESLKK